MNSRLFILFLVIFFLFAEGARLPFELKEERKFSGVEIFPIDINQDKVDELLRVGKKNIQLFDQKGRFYWDFYFTTQVLKTVSVCDYDKDGLKELFLTRSEGLNEIIECYRPAKTCEFIKKLITIKDIDHNHDGRWDGSVTAIDGIDANDDGRLDLLLNVGCSFDLQPRGLAVYDIETGKELWHYWIGPSVDKVILEDLNNDGKQEIVIGTYSTANGSEANNSSDIESYVIVLNRKGELLWQKPIGEFFTFTLIAVSNLDQESIKEVIAAQSTRKQGNEEPDKLVILDGKSGKEKRLINTGENFYGLACVDLNHDGINEIITGNSDGKIRVFNCCLDEIMSFQNNHDIDLMGVCDFQGDGRKELVTNTEDNRLLILDEKLRTIVELKLTTSIFDGKLDKNFGVIKPVRAGKENKFLIQIPKETESEFVLYNFVPVAFSGVPIIWLIILLVIVILFIGYIYIRNEFSLKTKLLTKSTIEKVTGLGLIYLSKKGRVIFANKKAEDVLEIDNLEGSNLRQRLREKGYEDFYVKTAKIETLANTKITIITSEGEKQLAIYAYLLPGQGAIIRVQDMTKIEHLKRIESWVPVAQKLAHGIKTPLMNIQLSAQQLETACEPVKEKTSKFVTTINEEVKRLRKLTDGFMKYTQLAPPVLGLEDINGILQDLVDKYSITLPSAIKIKYDLANGLPNVLLDKKEIDNAFSIIIDNAVEAMGKEGTLTVATSLQQKFEAKIGDWVRVEITDTGEGIPEKYMSELFKPYFVYNKPNGTGLGLTLAKKIIESHNGNIKIQSKEGIGTSVIIELPISK